ncbi:MFS transporter [Micromonospora sp. Llam7]|uniref:MFS transporter n=1 Tax=Micromonospora tarapacensis TaxID=2835305 RepID=UPI001C82EAF0|nr:MFS transporter [Micromonospora tarapacensis]MBX7266337.1 MFS transporter [Micromonospora tarapacensis]
MSTETLRDETPSDDGTPSSSLNRHRDFNKLWLGQGISAFGTEITTLALPLTAILILDASATQIGIMSALRELAFLGPLLLFGVLVDRMRRRPLMIGTDLARAFVIGLVPVLAFLDSLTMTVMYLVAFAIGCLSVVFDLAYRSYLPSIVSRAQLMAGNSRLQATDSLSQIAGPGLAGLLVQALRAPFALVVDAISFVASAIALMLVKTPEPPVKQPTEDIGRGWRGVFSDIGHGLRTTVRHPVVRALAGNSATFNFFSVLMLTLFVLYATREFNISPAVLGLIFAAFGVGGLLGAITMGRLLKVLGYGWLLIVAYLLAVVPIMAIPLVNGTTTTAAILFGVIHFVVGYGIVSSNIAEMTMRQMVIPQHILGRVNASFRFLIGGLVPISALVAGLLGDAIGLRPTLFITAVGIPLSLLWLIFSPIPKLRTVEDVEATA